MNELQYFPCQRGALVPTSAACRESSKNEKIEIFGFSEPTELIPRL